MIWEISSALKWNARTVSTAIACTILLFGSSDLTEVLFLNCPELLPQVGSCKVHETSRIFPSPRKTGKSIREGERRSRGNTHLHQDGGCFAASRRSGSELSHLAKIHRQGWILPKTNEDINCKSRRKNWRWLKATLWKSGNFRSMSVAARSVGMTERTARTGFFPAITYFQKGVNHFV